jgi:erythromycin esterase-like protein
MALTIRSGGHDPIAASIREAAEPFADIKTAALGSLLDQAAKARVVCIGEATHGTSEFYRMRAHITRLLIEKHGFDVVGIEGDWPDASHVDAYVRHRARQPLAHDAFARFPRWMWRNREVAAFVEWLRHHNAPRRANDRVVFCGLDLYSLFSSLEAVLAYLDRTSTELAAIARQRYACLLPWRESLQHYGRAVTFGQIEACERHAVAALRAMLDRRLELMPHDDGTTFFDATMNARLVANAERYYRAMFEGAAESWNLRDTHMIETLEAMLLHRGAQAKAIVWAHNSHVGDARFTAQSREGEVNIGQLAREKFGDDNTFLIGFGTHHGTVAAASNWDEPMEIKAVRPSRPDSYEHLCHESNVAAFTLMLKGSRRAELIEDLTAERLQRAIGVVYRPETERWSHYYEASLPRQFDAYIWFDTTRAVAPLDSARELVGNGIEPLPEMFPTGL